MEDQDAFSRVLDQELKRLPDLEAPPSLSGRVMERVQEMDAVACWRRPWFEWSLPLRVISAGIVTVWLIGLGLIDWRASLALTVETAEALGGLMELLMGAVRALPWEIALLLGVMAMVSWITLLGAGAICWRLVRVRK
jgi:uncharacterized protein YggT (Ycf19 family)